MTAVIPDRLAVLRQQGYKVTDSLASALPAAVEFLDASERIAYVWLTGRTDLVNAEAEAKSDGLREIDERIAALEDAVKRFNPNQPRDREGQWTDTGGGGGSPSSGSRTPSGGAFAAGDRVTYQHGTLGRLDAEVTKVTGKFPRERITVAYDVGGERRTTVMTTNQAAVRLEKRPDAGGERRSPEGEPGTRTGYVKGSNLRVGDYLHEHEASITELHHFGYRDQPFFPVTLDNGETVSVSWKRRHKITRNLDEGKRFDPRQRRDWHGRWTDEGGGGGPGGGGSSGTISLADLSPDPPPQPTSDFEDLYTLATDTLPGYQALMNKGKGIDKHLDADAVDFNEGDVDFADVHGNRINGDGLERPWVIVGPIKGRKRAAEKVDSKYGGDASRLSDVVRGTVLVPNAADVHDTVRQIRAFAERNGWKMTAFEDRFANPTSSGYRDIAVRLESPDGLQTELQVNTTHMWQAKEGDGHKLYEQERAIQARAALEHRELTATELADVKRLAAEQTRLYNAAWKASQ